MYKSEIANLGEKDLKQKCTIWTGEQNRNDYSTPKNVKYKCLKM